MKSLLRLFPYLKEYRWHILGSAFLAIPLAALRVAPAKVIQLLVDRLLVAKDQSQLLWIPAALIGIFILNFVIRFVHYFLMRLVVAQVNQRLKNNLYEHLMGLSSDYFTQKSTGELISRVASDTQYIDQGINSVSTLIREPLTFLGCFTYAFYLNWKMTLIMILVFPPLAWVFAATGRNLKRYISRLTEENARLFSTLQESFVGIRTIKAFNLENYVKLRFFNQSRNYKKILVKAAILEEASHPMVELLTAFALAGVVYYGGSEVIAKHMTPGDLMAFFGAFALMMNPLRLTNDVSIKFHAAAAACVRIFEIFDWKSHITEPPLPAQITGLNSGLELKNVEFAYPDALERKILKGVSFTIKKGEMKALVGASGSGKSSLVSLISRIFDVSRGNILWDGIPIQSMQLNELRNHIAVVSQDVFLFNDTVIENIRCGRLGASDAEVRDAARKAHALEFIEKLSGGFNAVIGDRGQKLSGGERQRLSIARAFLRGAPLLILDEATSSLDNASERAVQEALDELIKDRTTLVVAHRLSTIQGADEILVLKDGQVVESGNHTQLLGKKGEYFRLQQGSMS